MESNWSFTHVYIHLLQLQLMKLAKLAKLALLAYSWKVSSPDSITLTQKASPNLEIFVLDSLIDSVHSAMTGTGRLIPYYQFVSWAPLEGNNFLCADHTALAGALTHTIVFVRFKSIRIALLALVLACRRILLMDQPTPF
jgi:hypothetical protein